MPNNTQPPTFWSLNQRIGRLRFLAYSSLIYVFAFPAAFLVKTMHADWLVVLLGIFILFYSFVLGVRRSHDLNMSGWSYLAAAIIPFAIAYWIFGPGTRGENRFGAEPPPNNIWTKFFGLLLPIVFLIGILAAIFIPMYANFQKVV